MPIMPIEPAKEVRIVRPFLVIRLLSDSDSAVPNDIEVFSLETAAGAISSPGSNGSVSLRICPSCIRTIRVEYRSARSGLWVTMMTSFSREISRRISMI